MKKIFIALSVMAALAFSLAPVQANVPGARDIAPGSQFKSYFLVSKDRVDTGAGPSTLLQISETKGMMDVTTLPQKILWSKLHFEFYTVNSEWVYNDTIPITRWQTILTDMGEWIIDMGDAKDDLLTTFEGEEYYAGYVIVTEEWFGDADNILADVLQLDLSGGVAAIGNIPVKCAVMDMNEDTGWGCPAIREPLVGFHPEGGTFEWGGEPYEVFSGSAMAAADQRVWTGDCAWASWFALYPRYLINDENSAKSYWILMRNSIKNLRTGALAEVIPFHTWVVNKAEDPRSVTINIRELSILDAGSIVPTGLKIAPLPYIGQMNLKIPGAFDRNINRNVPGWPFQEMELVGWNWKMANDPASPELNWGGMSLIGADAGTVGEGYAPTY